MEEIRTASGSPAGSASIRRPSMRIFPSARHAWAEAGRKRDPGTRSSSGPLPERLSLIWREKGASSNFTTSPWGNLEMLKEAARTKKKEALKNLAEKSGCSGDLLYLDAQDRVLATLCS